MKTIFNSFSFGWGTQCHAMPVPKLKERQDTQYNIISCFRYHHVCQSGDERMRRIVLAAATTVRTLRLLAYICRLKMWNSLEFTYKFHYGVRRSPFVFVFLVHGSHFFISDSKVCWFDGVVVCCCSRVTSTSKANKISTLNEVFLHANRQLLLLIGSRN